MNRKTAHEQLAKEICDQARSVRNRDQIAKYDFLNVLFDRFNNLDLDDKVAVKNFRKNLIIKPALNKEHPCNQFSSSFGFFGAYIKHAFNFHAPSTVTQTATRELLGRINDFIEKYALINQHTEIEREYLTRKLGN